MTVARLRWSVEDEDGEKVQKSIHNWTKEIGTTAARMTAAHDR